MYKKFLSPQNFFVFFFPARRGGGRGVGPVAPGGGWGGVGVGGGGGRGGRGVGGGLLHGMRNSDKKHVTT